MKTNLAIFASGNGTNAENIIRYFQHHDSIRVALVVSNRTDAYVLTRAKQFDVPSTVVTRTDFLDEEKVIRLMNEYHINYIILAGFLLLIPAYLLKQYPQHILNIHPALLPKYGGKGMYGEHVHKAVVAAGEQESGITIHYIDEHYDRGTTLFQATCPVMPDDTPDDVAHKVHALEYQYYPIVIERTILGEALPHG